MPVALSNRYLPAVPAPTQYALSTAIHCVSRSARVRPGEVQRAFSPSGTPGISSKLPISRMKHPA